MENLPPDMTIWKEPDSEIELVFRKVNGHWVTSHKELLKAKQKFLVAEFTRNVKKRNAQKRKAQRRS
jgi:hypothetical protein